MQIYREINAYRTCNYRSLTEHNICSNRRNSKASGVASRTGNQLIDQSSFPFKGFSAYNKQFSIVQLVQYQTVIGSLLELFLFIMTFFICSLLVSILILYTYTILLPRYTDFIYECSVVNKNIANLLWETYINVLQIFMVNELQILNSV